MAGGHSIDYIYRVIDQYTATMNRMKNSTTGFGGAFNKTQQQMQRFGQSASMWLRRGLVVGAGLAVAGLTKLLKTSAELWDVQAGAIAGVEATLQSTGGTVGRTLAEITANASELQKNTFFGDESILQNVSGQLLTFTSIQGDAFDRASTAILDVTAKLRGVSATGTDLQGVTIQLAKALNDPLANMGALSRSGITFTQVQKDMVKTLMASGDLMGAQNIILTEVETQYGGTAAAIAQTTAGLKQQFDNLKGDQLERIGMAMEPLRQKFIQFKVEALDKLNPMIEKLTAYLAENSDMIFDKVMVAFQKASEFGRNFVDTVKDLYEIVKKLAPVLKVIVGAMIAYKAIMIISVVVTKVMGAATMLFNTIMFISTVMTQGLTVAQAAFNTVAMMNPIALIIIAFVALIAIIILVVKKWDVIKAFFIKIWRIVVDFVKGIVDAVKGFVKKIWDKFMELLDNPFFVAIGALVAPWLILPGLIVKHWDVLKAFFIMLWENIKIVSIAVWDAIKFAFETSVLFMKAVFFTFADVVLTIFGTIFNAIIKGVAGIGKALGFEMAGLDEMSAKIETTQASVRQQSFIGGLNSPTESATAPGGAGANANANASVSVYTEQGMKAEPFVASGNLGYNMSDSANRGSR